MDSQRLGDGELRRLENLADRFGTGNLAVRLGLTVDSLGSILSGDHEMGEGQVANLILLFQVLEALPSEAPDGFDEQLLELLGEDDLEFDDWEFVEEALPDGVVDAGPGRIVDEEEIGGPGGPRETSVDVVTKDPQGAVGETEAPVGSVPAPVVGVDIDQDGKPDVPLYGIDLSSRSGMSWMEQQDRRRTSLRNAHTMATMTQYRIGMTRMETVTALGLVTQIELALITCFQESLPEPGQNWDSQKRAREIERRLARLRWVEQQQNDEYSGLKGAWNRVRGRRRPSGQGPVPEDD